jgi:hypothetical protein
MFTQDGLNNLWKDLISGKFSNCSDIQVVCNSATERCMKVFLHFERRYVHFSSKFSQSQSGNEFARWVRTTNWQPESFYTREPESIDL